MGQNTSRQSERDQIRDQIQNRQLQEAAFHGRIETIRPVIRYPTLNFDLALETAFRRNHLDVVRMLMAELPSLNLTFSNNFMLNSACAHGDVDIVRLLLERGIYPTDDIAIKNACWNGHLEIVRLLLGPKQPRGIFLTTCTNGHVECARLLIERMMADGGRSHVDELREAFQFACEFGMTQIARLILDVGHPDVLSESSIHDAALAACKRGQTDVVNMLLEHCGVDTIQRALSLAVDRGHVEIVRVLLREHCVQDFSTIKGELWVAIRNGHARVVGQLLKFLPLDVDDELLDTYRSLAKGKGHRMIYAQLLAHRVPTPKPVITRALRDIAVQLLHYQEGILKLPLQCDDSFSAFATMFQSQMREKCERESVRIDGLLEQNKEEEPEDVIVAIEKEIADLEFMTLRPELNSLFVAAEKGFINAFRLLIKTNAFGLNRAMHFAILGGQTEIVRECAPFILNTHFIDACRLGHIDIVRLLFSTPLTINHLDRLEPHEPHVGDVRDHSLINEAIDAACIGQHIEVLQFLFEHIS